MPEKPSSKFNLVFMGLTAIATVILAWVAVYNAYLKPEFESIRSDSSSLNEKVEDLSNSLENEITSIRAQLSEQEIQLNESETIDVSNISVPQATFADLTSGNNLKIAWKASNIEKNCSGYFDETGKAWYEPSFDDSTWTSIALPDEWSGVSKDRFYRGYVYIEATEDEIVQITSFITYSRDDHFRLFINGQELARFRLGENSNFNCHSDHDRTYSQDLDGFLSKGLNVIGIHLTNGSAEGKLNFSLYPYIKE